MSEEDKKLIEFRLNNLEKVFETVVKDIADIKQISLRWDTIFSSVKINELPLLEKQVKENEEEIKRLEKSLSRLTKTFYIGTGIICAITFLVNAFLLWHSK